ncbi:MAG: hypothetical protein JST59_02185 [Actinobacteria bacterium]|nr:hypothetical protein [Actinomycetota bacterium]
MRFQQNNLREELRMELKEQYEQQIDEVMIKARDELLAEREKWFAERQNLTALDRETTMDTDSSSVAGLRDHELQAELKLTRELNTFLEKRVKEQEYKIKDFEDLLRKKK